MIVDQDALWLAGTNCYVVALNGGGPAVVVDAPPDLEGVVGLLRKHDLAATALLLTHGHIDHTGSSGGLARSTGAAVYLHRDDDFLCLDPMSQMRSLFGGMPPEAGDLAPPETLERFTDGSMLELAGLSVEVRHTPGHTPGHCCFYLESEGLLLSGDQLFAGSVGRTDFPYGNHDQLMASMEAKVLTLPDDTEVLPGHGPRTTLAAERRTNPFLAELLQ
ncbi:MAG: MBL fold metallo-hydrolase [Acidimicrobiia bacterium]|nr:MBL fold metallo-hydrolase [Acidimicrobiia bacterium]MDH3471343.1 MBL fold metallo-hydrolase [Acidimicrobiia bacterium]